MCTLCYDWIGRMFQTFGIQQNNESYGRREPAVMEKESCGQSAADTPKPEVLEKTTKKKQVKPRKKGQGES